MKLFLGIVLVSVAWIGASVAMWFLMAPGVAVAFNIAAAVMLAASFGTGLISAAIKERHDAD